ncbi:MAG: alpha-L-rhamnosidase C-terminal domain-containing protein, partial [Pseudomonadota bacterium]
PGFAVAALRPQLGSTLSHADGVVPTIRGPIHVVLDRGTGTGFTIDFTLPANMTANVALPVAAGAACTPVLDGRTVTAKVSGGVSWVSSVGSGTHDLHCQ